MRRFIEQRVPWPWSFVVHVVVFFALYVLLSGIWHESWSQRCFVGGATTVVWGLFVWFAMNPAYRRNGGDPRP